MHEMWLRITIDRRLDIVDAEAQPTLALSGKLRTDYAGLTSNWSESVCCQVSPPRCARCSVACMDALIY